MRKHKNKSKKNVTSKSDVVNVSVDECPSKVREVFLWFNMIRKKPFSAFGYISFFLLSFVIGGICAPFFTNLNTGAKWFLGGFTPCKYGLARLIIVSLFLLCVLFIPQKIASRLIKGILVTVAALFLLLSILGGLSRHEVPKDARMILLAAIEESQDGSVYLNDYQTYGATFSSHRLIPFYYDKSHSPALWMHGADYDDIGRIEHALTILESSGFMIHDKSEEDNLPIESNESFHSFITVKRLTVTDKGRQFYSRFYWLRHIPCLGIFFAPEYYVPLEGSDEETSRLNKISIDVLPK